MKILALSDIHGQFDHYDPDNLPYADLCIVAGDITNFGLRVPATYLGRRQQARDELARSIYWMQSLSEKYPHVFWIQGNHDIAMPDSMYDNCSAINIRREPLFGGSDAPLVQLGGLKFLGMSQCYASRKPSETPREVWDWDFTTDKPAANWDKLGEANIIVSHSPFMGGLGFANGRDIGLPFILPRDPTFELQICGHCHEQGGKWAGGSLGSLCVNVAQHPTLLERVDGVWRIV